MIDPKRPGIDSPRDGPVTILAVMTEVEALLERASVLSTMQGVILSAWRARLADHDVLIAASGIGKVNAAMATQALIERYGPRALIMSGSAGGLGGDVVPGDLVIGERAVQHDAGVNLGRRFIPMGIQVWQDGKSRTQRVLRADPVLLAAAEAAAKSLLADGRGRPPQVHVGAIATGDQVLFSEERKSWIHETWDALAIEMEGASMAQVAQANGVPWIIVRGISDSADDRSGLDLSRMLDYVEDGEAIRGWARRQGRRLGYLATHPSVAGRLAQLWKGIGLAAERSAGLTEALVQRLPG